MEYPIRRILISLAMANSAVLAQEIGADPVDLKGVVLNSVTGEPIAGAFVVLTPGFQIPPMRGETDFKEVRKKIENIVKQPRKEELATTTDEAGKFALHAVIGVGWSLKVSRAHYRAPHSDNDILSFQGPPTLTPDPVTIKLDPLGAIEGKVVNEDSEPVPGLSVELLKVEIRDGRRNLRRDAVRMTDDQGAYRLWHLSPGSYYLFVRGASPMAQAGVVYGPSYYPASRDLEGARLIRIAPGETLHADLEVAGHEAHRVRGKLVNATFADRQVTLRLLRGEEEMGTRFTTTSAAGTFEMFDVAPGVYTLQAASFAPPEPLFGETPITVGDGDLEGIALSLSPAVSLSGTVDGTASQWAGLKVSATHSNPRHLPTGLPLLSTGVPEIDGSFTLKGLWPGHYAIAARSTGPNSIRAITSGSIDVLAAGLTIGNAAAEPIRIQYGDGAAATITPKLAETVPDATSIVVALQAKSALASEPILSQMPAMVMPQLPASAITPELRQAMDSFTIRGLAPGEYVLYAWRNDQQVEYRNPAALAALSSHAVTVTVAAGDAKEVTVKLIPKGDQ